MKFPNKLIIVFKSKNTKLPIKHHGIYLKIRTLRKNDYDIGLRLTDEAGTVIFTEEEIKNEIIWTQNNFLMDYASTYDECLSTFLVILFSKEGIKKCLAALNIFKPLGERVLEDIKIIKRSENDNLLEQKWEFDAEKLLSVDGIVHLECLVDDTKSV